MTPQNDGVNICVNSTNVKLLKFFYTLSIQALFMNTQKLKGSQIIIETLIEQGVTHIFGYPGGQVLQIYDQL